MELNLKQEKEYNLLSLTDKDMSHVNCKKFNELAQKDNNHWIIDCKQITDIPTSWLREFVLLSKKNGSEKKTILLQTSTQIRSFIKTQGLSELFIFSTNLNEALSSIGMGKKKLNAEIFNPFLDATISTLEIQANVKSKNGKIFVETENKVLRGDISGVIGLVSDEFSGTVVISFPEKTFLNIMSAMLGEDFQELNQDLVDGAGELLNIIFGQAKTVLNEKGYGIKMAIPTVISGKSHSLSNLFKKEIVIVPFDSSAGSFFVEIGLC